MVIADARMSWEPSSYRPQDNLQKIYPLGPTGIIGFSGSVVAAKAIFRHLTSKDQRRPLPQTAEQIPIDIGAAAREAYSKLRSRERQDVQLMYAGADYSSIGLVADNMIMARNVMAVMSSPNFEVKNSPNVIRLGYAQHYPIDVLLKNRNSLMRHGTSEMGPMFHLRQGHQQCWLRAVQPQDDARPARGNDHDPKASIRRQIPVLPSSL